MNFLRKAGDIIEKFLWSLTIGIVLASVVMWGINQSCDLRLKKLQQENLVLQNHIYLHELQSFYDCTYTDNEVI